MKLRCVSQRKNPRLDTLRISDRIAFVMSRISDHLHKMILEHMARVAKSFAVIGIASLLIWFFFSEKPFEDLWEFALVNAGIAFAFWCIGHSSGIRYAWQYHYEMGYEDGRVDALWNMAEIQSRRDNKGGLEEHLHPLNPSGPPRTRQVVMKEIEELRQELRERRNEQG